MRFLLDSSSIIAMARAGRLDLLRRIVGKAHITAAVRDEIMALEDETTAAIRPALAAWIGTVPTPRAGDEFLRLGLHGGEASIIAVAGKDDILVIDEKQGRALANAIGFTCVGLLGMLLAATRDAIITDGESKECLDALERAGFWVSPHLRAGFLRDLESAHRRRE